MTFWNNLGGVNQINPEWYNKLHLFPDKVIDKLDFHMPLPI